MIRNVLVAFVLLVASTNSIYSQDNNNKKTMEKTDQQWKKELSAEQYRVLREKGTERAFTGEYDEHFEKGSYYCAGCNQTLFKSINKYDSGCGWPAFDKPIEGTVKYIEDISFGMARVEVVCSKCDGHLGHVFKDGPKNTTGERFCVNSVSLIFEPEK